MQDAIKQENRLTKMEEQLKNIEKKVDDLPGVLMKEFIMMMENFKDKALKEARCEDDKRYALKSDIKIVADQEEFEKSVKSVIQKEIGKWFLTTVGASSVIVLFIAFLFRKII